MDYPQSQHEENNYPKAFLATGIIVVLFALLCLIVVFTNPPPPEMGTGGILVNYGTTDAGSGNDITNTEEPSKAERPNHTKPTKVTHATPTPEKSHVDESDKKVVTQNTEDAPEVNSKSKVTSKVVSTEPTPPKPVKRTVNQNALYKGAASTGSGGGDGTTGTPGNQGSPNGSTLTNNYGKGGGGGNGGLDLTNWRFVDPPDVKNSQRVPGRVVVDFTIDQNGIVQEAHINRSKTKATLDLIQSCLDAINKSKFTSNKPASGNQRGEMTFIFKVD
jgi:TonB family protein